MTTCFKRVISFIKACYYWLICSYRIVRLRRVQREVDGLHEADDLLFTTTDGVEVMAFPGKKGPNDFIVKFRQPNGRPRTPRHIHLVVELYVKQAYDKELTHKLCDHFLDVFKSVKPITSFPPALQVYDSSLVNEFIKLDDVGEFSVEFLLVVNELIIIQEKTNYPKGSLTQELYEGFKTKDRFSVINTAVFGKRS